MLLHVEGVPRRGTASDDYVLFNAMLTRLYSGREAKRATGGPCGIPWSAFSLITAQSWSFRETSGSQTHSSQLCIFGKKKKVKHLREKFYDA